MSIYFKSKYQMISHDGKPILLGESWKDVYKLTKLMKMAIIPIAACRQHDPHLTIAVDTNDCYEVAKKVSVKTGVPVVSLLTYGCFQCHGDFPRTSSISPALNEEKPKHHYNNNSKDRIVKKNEQ